MNHNLLRDALIALRDERDLRAGRAIRRGGQPIVSTADDTIALLEAALAYTADDTPPLPPAGPNGLYTAAQMRQYAADVLTAHRPAATTAVGTAQIVVGAENYTSACFGAKCVPDGTKLYTAPMSADGLVDGVALKQAVRKKAWAGMVSVLAVEELVDAMAVDIRRK